jgi:hypothetical protein
LLSLTGESCTARGGGSGICRQLTNCPKAQQLLQRGQTPTLCGFDGFNSIVCCPEGGSSAPAAATTPPRRTTKRPPVNNAGPLVYDSNTKSEQSK